MDRDLTHLGDEYKPRNTDNIANIEEPFENKCCSAHDAAVHYPAGYLYILVKAVVVGIIHEDFTGSGSYFECLRRIGIYTQADQFLEGVSSYNFLLTEDTVVLLTRFL